MLCGQGSLINPGKSAFRAVSLVCNSWKCPGCFPARLRKLKLLLESGDATTFLTLTVDPATGHSPDSRARALMAGFQELIRRMRRTFHISHIPYCWLFEETLRGEPHLHILLRLQYIDQAWISAQMADLTGAPIVWIEYAKGKPNLCKYLAKYLSKGPGRFEGTKRYSCTRDWSLPLEEEHPADPRWTDTWYAHKHTLGDLRRTWAALGFDTDVEGTMLVAIKEADQ